MQDKKSHSLGGKCPCFALDNSKECGIVKGGVYIPMPEHIKMFCLSRKYPQCPQYIRYCELIMNQAEGEVKAYMVSEDRRKFQRFAELLYLDLVVCDANIIPREINGFKARTLDVSLGGLRIESPRELATDTILSFDSDPEFSSESLSGVGDVKWCRPQKDSDKFEFGIAFSDYSTSEGMRKHLGL